VDGGGVPHVRRARADAELLSARVTVTQPREVAIYDRRSLRCPRWRPMATRLALITAAITELG
jgi:hypothetical protein